MKRLLLLPLLLIPFLYTGCGTIGSQDRSVLRSHEVPPDVFDKMLYGDPLSLEDVITLSQHAVPAGLIIHYMDETDLVYILRKPDVKRLRDAGVSEEVIAYMLSTAPHYGPGGPPPSADYDAAPYPYAAPYAPYPYAPYPYPYGYYGAGYAGPVVFVGGYGRWGRGWGRGDGRGGGHRHDH